MKKVLAELHELINDLEDHGLTAEASSLQEVFVRVAQEAGTEDDLANDVESILKSHSAAEVVAEIAKQMASSEKDQTSSFAFGDEPGGYGNEPKDKIIDEFVTQVKRKENTPHDAYFMMNQRLQFNGHPTLTKQEFDAKVNSSGTNVSEFAFGDEPDGTESDTNTAPLRKVMYRGKEIELSPLSKWNPPVEQPEPAYREPAHQIMNEFIDQAIKRDMRPDDAYFMMNQRLESNGRRTLSREQFDTYVKNKSVINPNLTTRIDQVVAPPVTPEILEKMKEEWKEMTERHKKMGYNSPFHQSSR